MKFQHILIYRSVESRHRHPLFRDRSDDIEELEDYLIARKHHQLRDAVQHKPGRHHFENVEDFEEEEEEEDDKKNDFDEEQDLDNFESFKHLKRDHKPEHEGIHLIEPKPNNAASTTTTTESTTTPTATTSTTDAPAVETAAKASPSPSTKKQPSKLHALLSKYFNILNIFF